MIRITEAQAKECFLASRTFYMLPPNFFMEGNFDGFGGREEEVLPDTLDYYLTEQGYSFQEAWDTLIANWRYQNDTINPVFYTT